MERGEFIKTCCFSAIGACVPGVFLTSCESIYYATSRRETNRLTIDKGEFIQVKKQKESERKFVLIKDDTMKFPICVYKISENKFSSSLLKCTHNGCELNVGGGRYSCPCHGAEFSIKGEVLQGPAEKNLKTFKTESDNNHIYVYLS